MLLEPQLRISARALKVWRIQGTLNSLIFLLFSGGIMTLSVIFDWSSLISAILILVMVIHGYIFIYMIPKLRWKTWRYEVRETEIELQHGVFITKRTLIPMVRVQHVDTKQGPILKKYGLASVEISTAATVHEIPALDLVEAERIRLNIGKLTRVADEDV